MLLIYCDSSFWVIVTSLDPNITAAKFISVCREVIIEITGVSFVDDSSLTVTSEYVPNPALTDTENSNKEVEHLIQWLSFLSQHWEWLLFTIGGAINFQKSHWYLMSWLWKNGIPHLATSRQSPGKLSLTTGYQTLKDVVPRLEPTEGFRTLGVYITPSEVGELRFVHPLCAWVVPCVDPLPRVFTSESFLMVHLSPMRGTRFRCVSIFNLIITSYLLL